MVYECPARGILIRCHADWRYRIISCRLVQSRIQFRVNSWLKDLPKKALELSALAINRLREPWFYSVGGVAGLALQVARGGARTWILRITVGSKRRDIGLGGFPDVPLALASEKAREARVQVENLGV